MLQQHNLRYEQKVKPKFNTVFNCRILLFYKMYNFLANLSCILNSSVPVPKVCPKGWKSRKGSCYQVFSEKVNWFQAQVVTDQFINDKEVFDYIR